MPGGLIQLTAYGKEVSYLTGNPNLSYFKKVFKRHTNFVMEQLEQTFKMVSSIAVLKRFFFTPHRSHCIFYLVKVYILKGAFPDMTSSFFLIINRFFVFSTSSSRLQSITIFPFFLRIFSA